MHNHMEIEKYTLDDDTDVPKLLTYCKVLENSFFKESTIYLHIYMKENYIMPLEIQLDNMAYHIC